MKKISSVLVLLSFVLPMLLLGSVRGASGYQIVPLPPISDRNVFYGGSVMDVKFKLLDPQGNVVTDASATIWVDSAAGIGRGQFNTGNMFTIQGQNYVFKLDTRPLSAGPGSPLHNITIVVNVVDTTLSVSFNVALH